MTTRFFIVCQLLLVVAFFAVMGLLNSFLPYAERASYLEGRFGLDRSTALQYAFREVR